MLLTKIRPYIKKFHSSEYINALANGDICMALGWSGDILQAANRATEAKNGQVIKYHIPKEGTQMWFDMMAIPADAKNVEEAHIFLNYLNKPEVMAKAIEFRPLRERQPRLAEVHRRGYPEEPSRLS